MDQEWKYNLDLLDLRRRYEEGSMSFDAFTHGVSELLNNLEVRDEDKTEILFFAEQFSYCDNEDEFDDVLDDLYYWGDEDRRMWIGMI